MRIDYDPFADEAHEDQYAGLREIEPEEVEEELVDDTEELVLEDDELGPVIVAPPVLTVVPKSVGDSYDARGECTLGEEFGKCDPFIFKHGVPVLASLLGKSGTNQVVDKLRRRGVMVDWKFTGIGRALILRHPEQDEKSVRTAWAEEELLYLDAFDRENARIDREFKGRLDMVKETFRDKAYPGFPSMPEAAAM
jgi:hypothetical protein